MVRCIIAQSRAFVQSFLKENQNYFSPLLPRSREHCRPADRRLLPLDRGIPVPARLIRQFPCTQLLCLPPAEFGEIADPADLLGPARPLRELAPDRREQFFRREGQPVSVFPRVDRLTVEEG